MIRCGNREFILASQGSLQVPVMLAEDAGEGTSYAAGILAGYIEKISGARPEVIRGSDSVPESAIWIGSRPEAARLFPGHDLGFAYPEEILLLCNGKHLLISGNDKMVGEVQTEHGTANAVYTFIQDILDVRWFWPGPLGEDLVRKETIAIPSFEYRYHPQFLQRNIYRIFTDPQARDWARFQRSHLHSLRPHLGHGFQDWWEKYHRDHPDYFALQPDGTRSGYPRPIHAKLCESNPAVWDQWMENTEKRLLEDPALKFVSAMPNDDHSGGICLCENCRAWDNPDARPWVYNYEGGQQVKHVAMTDRYVKFWNILARRLRERFPGREIYLNAVAYGPCTPAPLKEKLEDNIVMGYCGKFPLMFDEDPLPHKYPLQGRLDQKKEFAAWAEKAPMLMFRPNLWYWGGGVWGLPELSLKKTAEDLRFVADHGAKGLFIDGMRGHWATQGPMYYLMGQMSWNPYLDPHDLMEEYYNRGFGKAAAEVQEYWKFMERKNQQLVELPDFDSMPMHSPHLVESLPGIYDGAFFREAEDILERAKAKVSGEPEIYARRLDFLETGLTFTGMILEAINLMKKVRESGGKDRAAVEEAIGLWENIDEHCRSNLPFAINLPLDPENRFRERVSDHLGPPSEEFRKAAGLLV